MDDKVTVYMRFYVGDYIADTRGMTLEQRGAYVDLLCHMWKQGGSIPLDHEMLWRLVGADNQRQWERVWNVIRRFFVVDEATQTFTNRRLQAEREAAIAGRKARATAGAAGGKAKAARRGTTPLPESLPSNARALPEDIPSNASDLPEHCSTLHPSSVNRQPSEPENPGDLGLDEPTTGLTAHAVIRALSRAANAFRPELGLWRPGPRASWDAREFCESFQPEQHASVLAELDGRAQDYMRRADHVWAKDGYPAKGFFRTWNGLKPRPTHTPGASVSGLPKVEVHEAFRRRPAP